MCVCGCVRKKERKKEERRERDLKVKTLTENIALFRGVSKINLLKMVYSTLSMVQLNANYD